MWVHSRRGKYDYRWWLTGGLASLAMATFATPCTAKPDFPGVIQAHWGGDCAPLCTLCHTRAEGGVSVADPRLKPSGLDADYAPRDLGNNRGQGEFFANLIAVNKKRPTSNEILVLLLRGLDTQACSADTTVSGNTMAPCDSDGDKTQDTKEFAKSEDPDVAGGELCVGPKYGCGASISPRSSAPSRPHHGGLVASFVAALAVLRRAARHCSQT